MLFLLRRLPVVGRLVAIHQRSTKAVTQAHNSASRAEQLVRDMQQIRWSEQKRKSQRPGWGLHR